MQDREIVDLYWARSENAISETKAKYGRYCLKIAMNIVANTEDSEECVNDTYMSAWNSMPEERPNLLAPFLAAITRNHALDLYRKNHSLKPRTRKHPLMRHFCHSILTPFCQAWRNRAV